MSDFRVTVKVRNARMLRAIEAAGFDSAAAFAREYNLSYTQLVEYLALKRAPIGKHGHWSKAALDISVALGALPEDLFPPQFLTRCLERNEVSRDVSFEDLMPALAAADPYKVFQIADASAQLNSALAMLDPRQADVLRRRNGLAPYDGEQTLDQVANALGVTRERIRQIELKAHRILAHPKSARGKAAARAMEAIADATA